MSNTLRTAFACSFALSTVPALADHPSTVLGVGIAQPVTTISAMPIPEGVLAIGLRTEFIHNDPITDSKLDRLADAAPKEDFHSVDSVSSTSLGVAWGVSDTLLLGARLPYVRRDSIREPAHHDDGDGGIETLGDSSGWGDLVAFGQFNAYRDTDRRRYAAVLLGVKTPTGKDDVFTHDGERLDAEFQPGSGSWDLLAGLALTQPLGIFSLDTSVLYTWVNEGSQNTDLGDALSYNAALSYRLHGDHHHASHTDWDLMLELNGEWREKENIDGETNRNSGGNLVYLSPGIRANPGNGWNLSLSAGLPVFENLNGSQSEPQWRVIGSLGKGW